MEIWDMAVVYPQGATNRKKSMFHFPRTSTATDKSVLSTVFSKNKSPNTNNWSRINWVLKLCQSKKNMINWLNIRNDTELGVVHGIWPSTSTWSHLSLVCSACESSSFHWWILSLFVSIFSSHIFDFLSFEILLTFSNVIIRILNPWLDTPWDSLGYLQSLSWCTICCLSLCSPTSHCTTVYNFNRPPYLRLEDQWQNIIDLVRIIIWCLILGFSLTN